MPASISVRAEMETLVAVSAPPRKQAVLQGRPSRCAAPAPEKERPDHARERDQERGSAGFAHAVDVGLETGDEHENKAADLREEQKGIRGRGAAEQAHMKHVNAAGAGQHAHHQLAENGGNSEARTDRRDDFPCWKKYGDQQRQLQSRGHPLLLGTSQYGRHCSEV